MTPGRASIRLKGYDYAQAGAYYVTVCAHERQCLFGEVAGGEVRLNRLGAVVAQEWKKTAEIRRETELDEWVVMPNHLHTIVWINVGAHSRAPVQPHGVGAHGHAPLQTRPPRSLGSLIAGFKSAATKRVNEERSTPGARVWQRNYWERVIRDEEELNRIREYIFNNPAQWESDRENPAAVARPEPFPCPG